MWAIPKNSAKQLCTAQTLPLMQMRTRVSIVCRRRSGAFHNTPELDPVVVLSCCRQQQSRGPGPRCTSGGYSPAEDRGSPLAPRRLAKPSIRRWTRELDMWTQKKDVGLVRDGPAVGYLWTLSTPGRLTRARTRWSC